MSNISNKIAAMIAKAESSSHPEEADAFMSKVHELLEKHGLSLQDIGTINEDDPVGHTKEAGYYFKAENAMKHVGHFS